MVDYNTLLRSVREKENLVGQARNDVEAAHQALIANRDTPPSKRTALHNAILEHGLASAQIIAHRQSPEYTSAKVELAERQKDVEDASNRGVPTKRYLGLRYMSSAQKEPDVPVAGPILTGPAVPHVPQADTNQSLLAEAYKELGEESFSAWIEAVGERTLLPAGCAVMFFTALDYVVNNNPLRWKVAATGFFFAILWIWARFFIEEGGKAGYVKAVAVTRSKLESPSSVALLHTAIDRNVESSASLGNGIVAIILALALAYDFKMLLVVGILGFIAIEGAMEEGIQASERGVRATQETAGYDIASPNKSVAETSAQAIEAVVQKHRRVFTLSSMATIVAAMAIGLTNKPVSGSGITYGEFQAVRMLPAILSVMLGISFLQEGMATGSEAARLVAIVDGELLKLEREELREKAKRAGDHAAFVFERQLEVEVQTAQRKVNDCSAAVKVDEDEESALVRRVENAMQVLEHAKLQYNNAHAALATHLLQ